MLGLKLLCADGHPVIFYDQAGCGKSSRVEDPSKNAPWLLTIDYYVEGLYFFSPAVPAHARET